jgi:hypothetical protein
MAWFEWVVSNPEVEKRIRGAAVDALIEQAKAHAHIAGSDFLFVSTNPGPFVHRLERHGFQATEGGMVNLICKLGE